MRFCRSQGGNLLDLKGKRAFIAFNERRPAMHILKSRPWNLPESSATPEALVFGRRQAMALGAGMLAASPAMAQQSGLPPAMRDTFFVSVLKIIKTQVGNCKMKHGSSPEKCLNYYGKPTSDDLLIALTKQNIR